MHQLESNERTIYFIEISLELGNGIFCRISDEHAG